MMALAVGVWIGLSAGFFIGLLWAARCEQRRRHKELVENVMSTIQFMTKHENVIPRSARAFVRDAFLEGVWPS